MKPASAGRHPDFLVGRVAVNDDLAPVGERDLKNVVPLPFKIQVKIRRVGQIFQRSFNGLKRFFADAYKFLFVHPCYHPRPFQRQETHFVRAILTLLTACVLAISGCGLRGPLVLPPGPTPEPVLGYPKGKLPSAGVDQGGSVENGR